MSAREEKIGLVVEAKDKASGVLTQIGAAGKKAFGSNIGSAKGLADQLGRLPDQLGKSATAMMLVQNATSQMGGQVADAGNKIAAVADIMATGGPMGLAMGALTIAIMAGAKAWEVYTMDSRNAENAQRSLAVVFEQQDQRLFDQAQKVKELAKQVRFFGQDSQKVSRVVLEEQIKKSDEIIRRYQTQVTQMATRNAASVKEREELNLQAKNLQTVIDKTKALNEDRKRELAALEQLSVLSEKKAKADDVVAKRARERAEADRKYAMWKTKSEQAAQAAEQARVSEIRARIQVEYDAEQSLASWKIQKQKEIDAAKAQAAAKREQENQAELAMQQQIAGGVADAWATAMVSIVTNQQDAGAAIIQSVIQAARTSIQAAAASSAAQAYFSQAGIPVIGPALAMAASSLAFGIVGALVSKIPKAERGLRVGGGLPGRDSVPVMMQSGEVALDRRQTDILDRLVSSLERQPQMSTSRLGGQTVVQQFNVTSAGAVASADVARAARDGVRLNRRAITRGF